MNKKLVFIGIILIAAAFIGYFINGSVVSWISDDYVNGNAQKVPVKKILKVSMSVSNTHPNYIAVEKKFKPEFERLTNGRYEVMIYPNGQLGNDKQATEAVKIGAMDSVVLGSSVLTGYVKELMVLDLPFVFSNVEEADYILDGSIGERISGLMAEKGLINISWFENGFRDLTTSVKEIRTPNDMNGLKIRVMESPIHVAIWKALGANPSPMPFTELFTALQQKIVDCGESPIAIFKSIKIHEVQKYCILTGHVYSANMMLFSRKVFDKMPNEDQVALLQAGKMTSIYNRQVARDINSKGIHELKQSGMTIIELTPEERKVFQDATAPVWDEFSNTIGKELIEEMKAELKKYRNKN